MDDSNTPRLEINQRTVFDLIASFSGQANILTIPRPFIDWLDGDHMAALLLSQILYWSSRTDDPDGWFYKRARDWTDELGMSTYQQNRAVKKLAIAGLETQLRKIAGAPTLHYRIAEPTFSKWIFEKLQNPISEKLENGFSKESGNDFEVSRESLLPETTAETIPQRDLSKGPDPKNVDNWRVVDTLLVERYIVDYSRGLGDEAELPASVNRAARLWARSGVDEDRFIAALYEARRRTQRFTGSIAKVRGDGAGKNKMAYFFGVLEDQLGLRD